MIEISEKIFNSRRTKDFENKKAVLMVYGTKPEVKKISTLYKTLKKSTKLYPLLVNTNQQKIYNNLTENLKSESGYNSYRNIDVHTFLTQIMDKLDSFVSERNLSHSKISIGGMIVQGDSLSAHSGAMWGSKQNIPVMHIR